MGWANNFSIQRGTRSIPTVHWLEYLWIRLYKVSLTSVTEYDGLMGNELVNECAMSF